MFYRTKVTLHRPFSGETPLGVVKVTVEAETEANGAREALLQARDDAIRETGGPWMDDHVTRIQAELVGRDGGANETWSYPYRSWQANSDRRPIL